MAADRQMVRVQYYKHSHNKYVVHYLLQVQSVVVVFFLFLQEFPSLNNN